MRNVNTVAGLPPPATTGNTNLQPSPLGWFQFDKKLTTFPVKGMQIDMLNRCFSFTTSSELESIMISSSCSFVWKSVEASQGCKLDFVWASHSVSSVKIVSSSDRWNPSVMIATLKNTLDSCGITLFISQSSRLRRAPTLAVWYQSLSLVAPLT